MHKPRLLVIAGCNGSGKSSFSRSLVPSDSIIPFDYAFHFLSRYKSLLEIDIKEQMAHNLASIENGKVVYLTLEDEYLHNLIPKIIIT